MGRQPTHIDGHHHVHARAGVLTAVIAEARRLDVPVRSPDQSTRERLRRAAVRTSDAFVDTFYGQSRVSEAHLAAILETLPEGESELMCHPAKKDDALGSLSSYAEPRYAELDALTSTVVRRTIDAHDVELARF